MKHCRHSAPAIRYSRPDRPVWAWLAVLLAAGSYTLQAAPVAITGAGSYSQNFDTLPNTASATWTDDSTLPGWYAQRSGSSGNSIVADAGSETAGNLYSYGSASTAERALGSIGSGTATAGNFAHGVQLQNSSSEAVTLNSLAYTGEQWRKSGVVDAQVVTLWYKISPTPITSLAPSVDAGWTALPAGDFSSPVNTSTGTSLDGNDSANRTAISINPNIFVPAGNYLMIRWKDVDHTDTDHGLAIDDVTLAWIASPVIPLSPGAIAFVGFNADGNDDLAFVALAPIAANDVIRFTDNAWNGSLVGAGGAFPAVEGVVTWTAPAGGVVAGTVVSLNNLSSSTRSASVGTVVGSSGSLNLNAEKETVYAYQGTPLIPSGFLAVIATHNGDSTDGTGLDPAHIIHLPNDEDIAAYDGSRSGQASFANYLTLLGVSGNWLTQDANFDQSNDGTAPDVPFSSTAFTVTSGNTFASWLVANAPDQGAGQDHDGDGVANSLEYFFGATGSTFTPNPQPVAGVISYPHPAATPGATYKIWTSPDLSVWTDVTADVDLATPGFVKYALPSGAGKVFARLEVLVVP